jgi:hypothetical protein
MVHDGDVGVASKGGAVIPKLIGGERFAPLPPKGGDADVGNIVDGGVTESCLWAKGASCVFVMRSGTLSVFFLGRTVVDSWTRARARLGKAEHKEEFGVIFAS